MGQAVTDQKTAPPAAARGNCQRLLPLLLLVAVTGAVYAVTAKFQLLNTLDDIYYITNNATVKALSFAHLKRAWSEFYVGNYAPVQIMSYMLDYALWGLQPAGYHLENVALHLINGVLFYLLLRRLALSEWQALAAAWIFLLHPVQVETVAWVSQRKNLLAMLFFLMAMLGYQTYLQGKTNSLWPYLLSILSAVAASLSKSIAVVLPLVLIFFDLAYCRQGSRLPLRRWADKLPFILVALATALLAVVSQSNLSPLADATGGRRDFVGGSPAATFFTMVPVLTSYLRDCFWPVALSPYYMVPVRPEADAVFLVSLFILMALLLAAVAMYGRSRQLLFWYGLFFIALVPVLHIVPLITLKHDRYLYFPLLGFAVVVVMGTAQLLRAAPQLLQTPLRLAVWALMLTMPLLTVRQVSFWQDDITIWSRAVAVDPENRLAWLMLAKGYTGQNRDAHNALRALQRYRELKSRYGPVRGYERE